MPIKRSIDDNGQNSENKRIFCALNIDSAVKIGFYTQGLDFDCRIQGNKPFFDCEWRRKYLTVWLLST